MPSKSCGPAETFDCVFQKMIWHGGHLSSLRQRNGPPSCCNRHIEFCVVLILLVLGLPIIGMSGSLVKNFQDISHLEVDAKTVLLCVGRQEGSHLSGSAWCQLRPTM